MISLIAYLSISALVAFIIASIYMWHPREKQRTTLFALLPVKTTSGWAWLKEVVVVEKKVSICKFDDGGYGWCEPRWKTHSEWRVSHYETINNK